MEAQIIQYITEKFNGSISKENLDILHNWISASEENKQFYWKTFKELRYSKDVKLLGTINKKKAWALIDRKTKNSNSRIIRINSFIKYAAVIVIPLLLASIIYYSTQKNLFSDSSSIALLEKIQPGSDKATLTLDNGQQFNLDGNIENKILIKNNDIEIKDSSNIIIYRSKKKNLNYKDNHIHVPIGGEYKVTLSDGTKVWLNSDTKFDFPVQFSETKRIVKLNGEAYFEVTKDAKPFIVETEKLHIKVLGTSFNVSAYHNDDHITTTLVSGKVNVVSHNDNVILEPGFQSVFKQDSLSVHKVDTKFFIDWKNGIFRFDNIRLQDLATKLSRWYNIDFFFDNDTLKEIRFSGTINKDNPLSTIIETLKQTNYFNYEVNENSILITN